MLAGDVVGDGKPKAHAAAPVLIARRVQPAEGSQSLVPPVLRNAGAVVLHGEYHRFLADRQVQPHLVPVFQPVLREVPQGPRQRRRTPLEPPLPVDARQGDIRAATRGLFDNFAQQHFGVDLFDRVKAAVAGEVQEFLQHPVHLRHVAGQIAHLLALLHQRERQPHPGQRRAHVVADAAEHDGALLDLPLDPPPHVQKRAAGLPHLCCARRAVLHLLPLAECRGGACQRPDRTHLIAQKEEGNQRHDCPRKDQQDKVLMRIGSRNPAARKRDLQRPVARFHPQMHNLAFADQVDDPRLWQLRAQGFDHRAARHVIEPHKVGLPLHRRRRGQHHRQRQGRGHPFHRHARRAAFAGGLRLAVQEPQRQGDIRRHLPGHVFVVALHKDDRAHRQQEQHRQQQDQGRPPVKRTGQQPFHRTCACVFHGPGLLTSLCRLTCDAWPAQSDMPSCPMRRLALNQTPSAGEPASAPVPKEQPPRKLSGPRDRRHRRQLWREPPGAAAEGITISGERTEGASQPRGHLAGIGMPEVRRKRPRPTDGTRA